jgi:hypothetical protein
MFLRNWFRFTHARMCVSETDSSETVVKVDTWFKSTRAFLHNARTREPQTLFERPFKHKCGSTHDHYTVNEHCTLKYERERTKIADKFIARKQHCQLDNGR